MPSGLATDVAKLMGALRSFAFLVILLAVFQTGKPVLLLGKPKFCPFFLQTELVECFLLWHNNGKRSTTTHLPYPSKM